MLIRQERPSDHVGIARITEEAFALAEHRDGTEADIVSRLRAAGDLTLSLVLEDDDAALIGHVAFSPVVIDGVECGWFGLGPVSVRPDRQRGGIGTALIRAGLEQLRSRRASGCVVLGDPTYYRRFGFGTDAALRYESAPAEYFMRINFGTGECPAGRVGYRPAFAG